MPRCWPSAPNAPRERGLDQVVTFEQGNAEELPYPDKSFDCVTIAFGIRNVPRIDRALAEAYRVLKFGGRFLCLEFSAVDVPGLDKLYELYSFQVIPTIGRTVTGDREAYQYLVESIRKFPKPKAFATMIEQAGFRRVVLHADDRRHGGAAFGLEACDRRVISATAHLSSRPRRLRVCARGRAGAGRYAAVAARRANGRSRSAG